MRWSEPPHDKAEGKIRNYETSRARPRPPSLISFSLGDCDGHICVHRPALARQTLIETKTGAAVQISYQIKSGAHEARNRSLSNVSSAPGGFSSDPLVLRQDLG